MRFARLVFYFEAIAVNLLTAIITFFFPAWFVSVFSPVPIPAVPLELIRWYGVLLLVFTYGMLRVLISRDARALAFLVEAFLLGDVAHFIAALLFLRAGGPVNAAVIYMFGMTVFLASVRVFWLWMHYAGRGQRHSQDVPHLSQNRMEFFKPTGPLGSPPYK